jgi:hypothetical protein
MSLDTIKGTHARIGTEFVKGGDGLGRGNIKGLV